ncbi:MAG TPA: response regulator, partial [Pseudolabrys sp.]|nr:response regulator [Pseudolabrys sp.]
GGWRIMGPAASVQQALQLLKQELPSTALLDVHLGDEVVTPVAERLKAHDVPFAVASAYDRPEQFGGEVLSGAPNVGKPVRETRLLETMARLTNDDFGVC